jgi:hypothetical protein
VSSAVESVLGHLPSDTFLELAAEFQKMEDRHSWLTMRIYDLLLGPPTSQG